MIKHVSEIGPQCDSDNAFTKKARKSQSIYRATILGEEDYGVGPHRNSLQSYGNMLVNGKESGKNFLLPSTFQFALQLCSTRHKDQTIDEYRLFNNMLSSMPMCFNLFHPILEIFGQDPIRASEIIVSAISDLPISLIKRIVIEFVPAPKKDYLNDKTGMDCAILFESDPGSEYLLSIETKYTEPLGTNKASQSDPHIQFAKELEMFDSEGIARIEANCGQIFRNFLLAEKYRTIHNLKDAYSIIISPEGNSYTEREFTILRDSLKDEFRYKVKHYTLERCVNGFEASCPPSYRSWINDFRLRYLTLT